MSDTRVLVTGAGGQLGRALVASAPPGVEVVAANHAELDVGAADAVAAYVARVAPQVVINAAGYTAVDAAESDADGALRVNGAGVRHLARALRERSGARLVQVSTDYVFDGRASSPYAPEAEPAPLGAYGASKLAGERAASEELGARAAIVRSAWIYSAVGRNFFLTMLRLLEQRGEVAVVADQVGTPTSAGSLATALWRCAVLPVSGVLHWTDAGVASWYDFAVAIAEEAAAKGLVRRDVVVRPIATVDYPTAARRPAYSVLDKRSATASLGIEPRHWRVELRAVIAEYADA